MIQIIDFVIIEKLKKNFKKMPESEKKTRANEANSQDKQPEYKTELELASSKPDPVTDPPTFEFNDLKKGQIINESILVRNAGGPFKDIEIFILEDDPFLSIMGTGPLEDGQPEKLPMKVSFEAHAKEWSKRYTNTIVIALDGIKEKVVVELDTQTKPVNDFALILKSQNKKIMTALIDKLERNTSVEIAVVTIDSLEGKPIEKYANDLFNEWGIGKEDKNNGILILLYPDDNKYRAEVGIGLEKILKPGFIKKIFDQYAVPNFKFKKFGEGVIQIIKAISAKITSDYNP